MECRTTARNSRRSERTAATRASTTAGKPAARRTESNAESAEAVAGRCGEAAGSVAAARNRSARVDGPWPATAGVAAARTIRRDRRTDCPTAAVMPTGVGTWERTAFRILVVLHPCDLLFQV